MTEYVYVMQKGYEDICKVGKSNNPEGRVKAVRKSTGWDDVRLVEFVEVPSQLVFECERAAKDRLREHNYRVFDRDIGAEWFAVNPATAMRAILESHEDVLIIQQSLKDLLTTRHELAIAQALLREYLGESLVHEPNGFLTQVLEDFNTPSGSQMFKKRADKVRQRRRRQVYLGQKKRIEWKRRFDKSGNEGELGD